MNKLDLKSVSLVNEKRLKLIKTRLNKENITSISQVKSIGGSATFYSALNQSSVLWKDEKGRIHWNDSIPVTLKLATTLTKEARKKNNNTPSRNTKVKNNKTVLIKPKRKTNTILKASNKVIENKKTKSIFEISFGWGLFKYKKEK